MSAGSVQAGEAGPSNAGLEIYNKLQLESMRIPELQVWPTTLHNLILIFEHI